MCFNGENHERNSSSIKKDFKNLIFLKNIRNLGSF